LMFILNLPMKIIGTINSFVAILSQTGGIIKHFGLKHLDREGVWIAIVMSVVSILGSYLGATLVFHVGEKTLGVIFGILLLLGTTGIYKKITAKNH
jgi:uncharacterized membrane protein YfcA